MPIIGNVDEIVVPINGTSTLHVPHSFQGCLAQQGASEGDVLAIASVNVICKAMEGGMVNKYPVHSIYEAVEEAHLQDLAAQRFLKMPQEDLNATRKLTLLRSALLPEALSQLNLQILLQMPGG